MDNDHGTDPTTQSATHHHPLATTAEATVLANLYVDAIFNLVDSLSEARVSNASFAKVAYALVGGPTPRIQGGFEGMLAYRHKEGVGIVVDLGVILKTEDEIPVDH